MMTLYKNAIEILHYNLHCVKILSSLLNGAILTGSVTHNLQNSCYFWCPVWKTNSWQESKPTRKLKHINSILEYFWYFCQISSKLILIISSYTVSKFTHCLRHEKVTWYH